MKNALRIAALLVFGVTCTVPIRPACAQQDPDDTPPPAIRAWMDRLSVAHEYDPETGYIVAKEIIMLPPILAEAPALDEAVRAAKDARIVVAVATADRCAPCQQYKKAALNDPRVIEAFGRPHLLVTHVEVDREPALAMASLGSMSIPMTYALHRGERIAVLRGQRSAEELLAWLDALPTDSETADLLRETNTWHAARLERLGAGDGWLSLVGLEWLKEGPNRVGNTPASEVMYAGFPVENLATMHVEGGKVHIELPAGADLQGVPPERRMRIDSEGDPTVLRIGDIRFHIIERGGRLGVRIKDAEAHTRTEFDGIERYPVDRDWRIEAAFEAVKGTREVTLGTVLGTDTQAEIAGVARFTRGGHTVRAFLFPAGENAFYLRFGDTTNGDGTYPIGRYLSVPAPSPEGTVILDFNRSYSPPCAFTPFATCTLPPEPNEFPFPIEAGERWGDR